MTSTDTQYTPTLEEAKAYITTIDFSMVVDKIVATKHWKKADVLKIGDLYKNYLFLQKKYSPEYDKLPPSEEIDEFWHNHILDTKKYRVDCEKIFGFYLDHYPYFGIDGKTNMNDLGVAFKKTQELHHKEFGDYIYNVRNVLFNQIKNILKLLITPSKSRK